MRNKFNSLISTIDVNLTRKMAISGNNLNAGMKCVKYMLLVINFMFGITAVLLMLVGSTIQSIFGDFGAFIDDHFYSPAALLVAVGIIMLAVSTFGCFGAFKESTLLINVYACLLFMIFILEIAASIAAFALQGQVREMLIRNLNSSMYDYPDGPAAKSIDFMQNNLECCGINNYTDWQVVLGEQYIPDSCCAAFVTNSTEYCEEHYEHGCLPKMNFLISQSAMLVATGATTVAFVQFLGVLCAFMLARTIRRNKSMRDARRWQFQQNISNLIGTNANEKNFDNGYRQMAQAGVTLEKSEPVTYTANSPSVN